MSDSLAALAEAAGLQVRWRDYQGGWHDVGPDTLQAALSALNLPAGSPTEIKDSHAQLAGRAATLPPLITAEVGQPTPLPAGGRWELTLEDGSKQDGVAEDGRLLPAIGQAGYHTLSVAGQETTVAVAPRRAYTVQDAAPGSRPWVLATQLYALRRPGDGGLGDFAALQDLLAPAAELGAAGVAISPVHAQFSADTNRFSPYSPSSRVQMNVLHAGLDLSNQADAARLEALDLVDWPKAARVRLAALRDAYAAASPEEKAAFAEYRAKHGSTVETHAAFEALHAQQFGADPSKWHWRTWPSELRHPDSQAVREFAARNPDAVGLHAYMQFKAERSLASAQQAAKAAGMPIGLIADLAVGADSGGSHCWSRQEETLLGMGIGAPPDLLSANGQNWGLAAFSPRGLRDHGYRAFLEMLRHAMRHAGGVRIDHALGLARLWVVPDGASAKDGAYLSFPLQDMLRLVALESTRNQAVVMGEDLGTIPEGFQDRLGAAGVLGMRVLWFEKRQGTFSAPRTWSKAAAAMTSTHDLPTVAGWWSGRDLQWRGTLGLSGDSQASEEQDRVADRRALWAAFNESGAADGEAPAEDETAPVVDAALRHLATSACDLVIIPIEDALGAAEQPNLPGTMDPDHPNWRRRLPGPAADLLRDPAVARRLQALNEGRKSA